MIRELTVLKFITQISSKKLILCQHWSCNVSTNRNADLYTIHLIRNVDINTNIDVYHSNTIISFSLQLKKHVEVGSAC